MARQPVVLGYETLTVAASALALTGGVTAAKSFVGKLETAQIRARGDGTDPTSSEGVIIDIGDIVYLSETEIAKTKFIRTGSTSGVLKGHFYNVEVDVLLGAGV